MKIHQVSTAISVGCLGLSILLVVPTLAKAPPIVLPEKRVTPITPDSLSETRELKLASGESVAIVKLWQYRYNGVVPNTDLKVIKDAVGSRKYLFLILESDDQPPVWGWYCREGKTLPINQEFVNRYPEVFNAKIN